MIENKSKYAKKLTKEQHLEIKKMYEEGVKIKDISAKFGITNMGVYKILKKFNVETNRPTRPSLEKEKIIKMYQMYLEGVPRKTIAKSLGINITTVMKYMAYLFEYSRKHNVGFKLYKDIF